MNYKSIALMGLLLPIFGYAQENANHLKELKDLQYQKALEIRELRKIISEGDEYIRQGGSIYSNLVKYSASKKKKKLDALAEENGTKKIELGELHQAIEDDNDATCSDLVDALYGKQEFTRSLFDELFNLENITVIYALNSNKFLAVSAQLEIELMRITIIKYEKCIQELIEINKVIFNLEK